MRRREFITLAGGAAAWPVVARAQQAPGSPVVGYLITRSADDAAYLADAFREGLGDSGFIDGQNVRVECRWGNGRYERLAGLAKELAHIPVAVLAATGGEPAVVAAREASSTIPVVFAMSGDPIKLGLAASFNRPGGMTTGVNVFNTTLEAKRFGLLRDMVPQAPTVAAFIDFKFPQAPAQLQDLREAAKHSGVELRELEIKSGRDIDEAFQTIGREHIKALFIVASPLFDTQRAKVVTLSEHYRVPTMFHWREYAAAGGLMSYGIDLREAHRQVGRYAGQILRGAKPGDLPIVIPSKFEFVINLKAAKAIDLTVPPTLLARADEVIE